ncbi:FAD/NAD(P)-binding domain-containing protein [Hypomontagnella submonticulosa]|nr:FAD/NAD(P)-binding domain-containing protein [Hypomontagnella submonticulosa]
MHLQALLGKCLALASSSQLALTESSINPSLDPASYSPSDVLYRDVLVIGGGSAGTYTAVRLKDYNKTVVVVEKKDALGGHTETYVDPGTGHTIDVGVTVFAHLKVVTDYFARFNVPLTTAGSWGQYEYVDFSTGKAVNYTPPSQEAFGAALSAYSTQLQKYPAIQGSFNLTYPVPEDLLLSFGEFVTKYNLQDIVPTIFIFNQGYAPLLDISMLYIFKYLNSDQLNSFAQGFLTTVNHNAQEVYQKATAYLGYDAQLGSTVISMDRSLPDDVRVAIRTPAGQKLILAKKVVSTVPPLIDNLGSYDLSDDEKVLFGQFSANGYYSGVLNNTGFDIGMSSVAPDRPYAVPQLPGLYTINVNQGLTQVYYGSPKVLPEEDVKADILATVRRVQEARGLPITTPEWLAFANHAPFNLMVSNEAIRDGFYEKLFALQGQRNTFYNGAAWHTQDSSILWQFTEDYILPILLAAL